MQKSANCLGSGIPYSFVLISICLAIIDGSVPASYLYGHKPTWPPEPPVYAKLSAGIVRGYVSYAAGRDKPVNVFKVGKREVL